MSDEGLFAGLDTSALADLLERFGVTFKMKLHPYSRITAESLAGAGKSVLVLDSNADVYELLQETAVLITDYSSIYFEFLLTGRPVIFTPFDREEYLGHDRSLYFDYDEVTPGPKCCSWEETLKQLDLILSGRDSYEAERRRVRDLFNTYQDFRSTERVYRSLLEGKP